MPRVHKVNKARKPQPNYGIEVGDTYYWWKFRYGGKRVSKTYPHRSQLTQSPFLSTLWEIEDGFVFDPENVEGCVEDLKGELENLKDECEGNLENMPEHLQESSSSGETLRERIDSLEEWIDNLESIDFDIDEELDDEERQSRLDEIESDIESANPGIG